MTKNAKISISDSYHFYENKAKGNFTFLVITYEPIKIQKCWAPQNDLLNLFFLESVEVPNTARSGLKIATSDSVFPPDFV